MPDTPKVLGVRTPEHPVPPTEVLPKPEPGFEQTPIVEPTADKTPAEAIVPAPPVKPMAKEPAAPSGSTKQAVEKILSAGLGSTYQALDPATQAKFKQVGEETAGKIIVLLQATKVQVKKIIDLIVNWLRIIPRVNDYFLEQEAKIKADRLLRLRSAKSDDNLSPP